MDRKVYNTIYYEKNKAKLRARSANYRESHKDYTLEYQRQWQLQNQHPCLDCGKLCSHLAVRCKRCAAMVINTPKRKVYPPCIDCDGVVSRGRGLRCKKCANKARRKIKRFDGKCQDRNGYIRIGERLEHRIIWEQVYGKLDDGWVVHHLNGVKDDNQLKNLIALPKGKHHYALLMQAKNKRIQELEALLKRQGQLV